MIGSLTERQISRQVRPGPAGGPAVDQADPLRVRVAGKDGSVRTRLAAVVTVATVLAGLTMGGCGNGAPDPPPPTPTTSTCNGHSMCPTYAAPSTVPPSPAEQAVFARWCSLSRGDSVARVTAVMGPQRGRLMWDRAVAEGATDIGPHSGNVTLSEWDVPGVQLLVRFLGGRVDGMQAFAATAGMSASDAFYSSPSDLPCAVDR